MRNTKRVLSMILAVCMLLSVLPMSAFALTVTDKPENGTTEGQPFSAGTGGSTYFRIPGLVTLDNGTLIATTDARWNGTADAGGIDTIVSVSEDNGENWTYTFANYLGDNGNYWINTSCCFIDPAIGTNGTTAYMIADLYPAGFAINSARYYAQTGSTGFDANGNLLLRSDDENSMTFGSDSYASEAVSATYGYYLADGKIYTTEGAEVEGYSVDAYFNLTYTDADGNAVNTNLFFSDSPYKPYPTNFLYMTTTENGLDWSEPELLNLKAAEEQSYLVGPGNGTYDAATGNMVFTAYRHTGGNSGTDYECTSLIWMDENGNWSRSGDATTSGWSSEASAVVLADGTVRVFYRDGYSLLRYTDYHWSEDENNYVRDENATEVTTTAAKRSGCQLTAIKYSQLIDGKEAIIVATPTYSGGRNDGHVYVFLVEDDNTMTLAYDYDITPDSNEYYAYSCISELNDGNLGLLWESNGAALTYTTIAMDEVTDRDNDSRLSFVDVTVLTGETATYTDNSGYYGDADTSELDTNVATVEITGSETTANAAQVLSTGANVDLDSCLYTFTADDEGYYVVSATAADGTTVYLNHYLTTGNNIPNITTAGQIAVLEGSVEGMFQLQAQVQDGGSGNARTLHFHAESTTPYWNRCGSDTSYKCHEYLFRKAVEGDTESTDIPGYVQLTSLDEVVSGSQYLIAAKNDAGNWYVLNPTASTTSLDHVAQYVGQTTVGNSTITFTGVATGYTEVQIGSTVYRITAKEAATVAVTLPVGSTASYTHDDGNYADADTSALDTSVATVTLEGSNGANASGVAVDPSTTLVDGTYVILNTRAGKLVNNTSASASAAAGSMAGLALSGTTTTLDADTAVWTITAVEGGYTVQDANGKYMTIGSNAGGLSDDAQVLTIAYADGTWTLMQNSAYLNDAAGAGTTASGWEYSTAATDAGSQFDLYAYGDSVPAAGTTVTFTGVYPGTTSLTVDRVSYEITVTGTVVDVALNGGESASYIIGSADAMDVEPDASVATAAVTTIPAAQLGSAQSTYEGDYVDLSKLLYTFTQNEDGTTWTVSGTDAEGNTVYLEPYATTNGNGYPHVTEPVDVTLSTGYTDNSVYISGNGGYLHFWRSSKLYFDRTNTTSGYEEHTSFLLYRPAADGEESSTEIPGYVLVEGVDAVTAGQYLIVAQYDTDYYLVYPSASTAHRSAQIAHLVDAARVTITAAGEGETTARVGSTIFEIAVAHSHSYTGVVTAATCTEGGYTTYTCSCGDSYVGDETEALGHTFENGTCSVCGAGIAHNKTDDVTYATLAEALAAAGEGDTVMLLGDCAETKVLVTPNVTLDLNGKTLTADYVVGFNSADIVDNAGGGKLIVVGKNVVLDEDNGMVPVYDEDGYVFTQVGFAIRQDGEHTGEGKKVIAVAYPTDTAVAALLADGAADNNLQVVIELSWDLTDETGAVTGTGSQEFVFTDEVVAAVYSSGDGTFGGYTQMFSMVITGIENVENLNANIVLVSGTNVEYGTTPVPVA